MFKDFVRYWTQPIFGGATLISVIVFLSLSGGVLSWWVILPLIVIVIEMLIQYFYLEENV